MARLDRWLLLLCGRCTAVKGGGAQSLGSGWNQPQNLVSSMHILEHRKVYSQTQRSHTHTGDGTGQADMATNQLSHLLGSSSGWYDSSLLALFAQPLPNPLCSWSWFVWMKLVWPVALSWCKIAFLRYSSELVFVISWLQQFCWHEGNETISSASWWFLSREK